MISWTCLGGNGVISSENPWFQIRDGDPRARSLFNRHYSAHHCKDGRKPLKVLGPGEYVLLMTSDSRAIFGWIHNTIDRMDGQVGVNCSVFRNEGPGLSSELILAAEEFVAWKWPDVPRLFTYVDAAKVASPNPGYCFKVAGWQTVGKSKSGKVLLEKVR